MLYSWCHTVSYVALFAGMLKGTFYIDLYRKKITEILLDVNSWCMFEMCAAFDLFLV